MISYYCEQHGRWGPCGLCLQDRLVEAERARDAALDEVARLRKALEEITGARRATEAHEQECEDPACTGCVA